MLRMTSRITRYQSIFGIAALLLVFFKLETHKTALNHMYTKFFETHDFDIVFASYLSRVWET